MRKKNQIKCKKLADNMKNIENPYRKLKRLVENKKLSPEEALKHIPYL